MSSSGNSTHMQAAGTTLPAGLASFQHSGKNLAPVLVVTQIRKCRLVVHIPMFLCCKCSRPKKPNERRRLLVVVRALPLRWCTVR